MATPAEGWLKMGPRVTTMGTHYWGTTGPDVPVDRTSDLLGCLGC